MTDRNSKLTIYNHIQKERHRFDGIIGNCFETSCRWSRCRLESELASKSVAAPPTPVETEGVAERKRSGKR